MRKRKQQQATQSEISFTMRMREADRELLDECAAHRASADSATLGRPIKMTAGEFVVAMLHDYARERKIVATPVPPPAIKVTATPVPPGVAAPAPVPKEATHKEVPKERADGR